MANVTDVLKYVFCDGQVLEAVHSIKYLCVVFSHNGSFKTAIDDLYKRASKAMFALMGKCRKLDLSIDIRLELFDRLVHRSCFMRVKSGALLKLLLWKNYT